ncbi:hypothetical protein BH23ACT9_BH23ACT9_28830 [soil metagenome]
MTSLAASTPSLLALAREGDGDALDALLREQRSAIEAVCRRRLRSLVDADDAVQETMVRAMRSLDAVRDPARLQSYLCRIAERVCLDMMRSGARPMRHAVIALDEARGADRVEGPESLTLRKEEAELVRRTLQALSDRQAQALWMRDALGEPVPVVAETLGVTEGSARVILTRARKQMRDGWAKVAAIIPGFGLQLPAPLAKIGAIGGLVPVAVVPAVALIATAALVLPGLFATDDPPATAVAPGVADIAPVAAPQAILPTVTAVMPGELLERTPTQPAPSAPVADRVPAAPGVTPSPQGGLMVGSDTTGRVAVDNDDPRDDDVTLGREELLGVGSSLSETLGALELQEPSQDMSAIVGG